MLEHIESIITIAVIIISAIFSAAYFIISKIPTRLQVDKLRAEFLKEIADMKASISEDVQNKIDSKHKDVALLISPIQTSLENLQDMSKKK